MSASRIQLRREAEVTGADMLHELRLIRRSILSHPSVYDGWLHLAAISDHLGLCIEQLAGRRLPFSCADCLTGRVQFTIYPDGLIGPCTQIMPFADLRRYGFDIERFLWEFRPHRLMEQYGSRQCTEGCFVMQNALFSPRRLGKLLVGPYLERLGARAIMR